MSELMFHMAHGAMWKELNEVATNLRYVEARCSLGLHQAHALCHDLSYLCTQTAARKEWIKTDFLNVKDCLVRFAPCPCIFQAFCNGGPTIFQLTCCFRQTMVKRYISVLFKNPRWTFSIAANLPDSTGPARYASLCWAEKLEQRPQLVWQNKPTVDSPCSLILDEHKIVIHRACVSHDMSKLVAVGQDTDVWVWQLPGGEPLCKLEGHTDHVMACSFAFDDSYLITGARDGTLNSWTFTGEPPQEEPESPAAKKWGTTPWLGRLMMSVAAHSSTIWSCAHSTTYNSGADVVVPVKVDLGHGMFEIEHRVINTGFQNFSSKEHHSSDRFPVRLEGVIKRTRPITEAEKREMRLHKVRKSNSRGPGRRTPEAGSRMHTAEGSRGSGSNRAPTPPDASTLDFKDELELKDKFVWMGVEESEAEEHLALWLVKLAAAGLFWASIDAAARRGNPDVDGVRCRSHSHLHREQKQERATGVHHRVARVAHPSAVSGKERGQYSHRRPASENWPAAGNGKSHRDRFDRLHNQDLGWGQDWERKCGWTPAVGDACSPLRVRQPRKLLAFRTLPGVVRWRLARGSLEHTALHCPLRLPSLHGAGMHPWHLAEQVCITVF